MVTIDLLKALAQAEPFDTDLKRRAPTLQQMLKQGFQAQRSFNDQVDITDFATGQALPARPYGHVISQTTEEDFDLRECKAHAAGERDEQHSMKGLV
jgi:hypothetical protein